MAYTSKFGPFNSGLAASFAPSYQTFVPYQGKAQNSPMSMAGAPSFAAMGYSSSGGFDGNKGPFAASQYSSPQYSAGMTGSWQPASTVAVSPFQFFYSGVVPSSSPSAASYASIM